MSPRVGALFAGYGGLDLAVTDVFGGELAWYSEVDKGALKILAHRFPDVPNVGDVTAVDWSTVEPVDILTGGSPCQDLSHAGKRAGMTEGTRSNLWVAMREAIAQLRPRLIVWENVRGAASAEATSDLEHCPGCMGDPRHRGTVLRALGRVVGDLADLGYVGQVRGLRAADVGAPHGRFRYFLAAHPEGDAGWLAHGDGGAGRHGDGGLDLRTAVHLLPTPVASEGTKPSNTMGVGRRKATGEVFLTNVIVSLCGLDPSETPTLLPTPAVNDMGEGKTPEAWDEWTADMQAKHGNGNGHGKSLAIEAQRLLPTPRAEERMQRNSQDDGVALSMAVTLLPTPTAGTQAKSKRAMTASRDNGRRAGGGQSSPLGLDEVTSLLSGERPEHLPHDDDLPPESRRIVADLARPDRGRWGQYAPAISRWEHVLGRPAPEPTQTSSKGNPQLSPRFVEWMMGLPAGWVTDVPGITRNEALKALGNGVVPQQAAAALRTMLAWRAAA